MGDPSTNICFDVAGYYFFISKDRIETLLDNSYLGGLLRFHPNQKYFELDVDPVGFTNLHRFIMLGAGKEEIIHRYNGFNTSVNLALVYIGKMDLYDKLNLLNIANKLAIDIPKHNDIHCNYVGVTIRT